MAPNTPNEFAVIESFAAFKVKDLSNPSKPFPITQQGFSSSTSTNANNQKVETKNKIYFSYEEIHNAVHKTIRPFSNQYVPDVVIAVNGGGSFISMLLGVNVPILSIEISKAHNFISNNNDIFQIKQWIDETSTEGLRVNHSRILLLTDTEIMPGMLNFVRNQLYARSMPSEVAAAMLHQRIDGELDSMEVVHAAVITSNTHVYYPWNSNLEYSQHNLKATEKRPQSENLNDPTEGYWDWPAEDPLCVTQIERHIISDSKRRIKASDQKVSDSDSVVERYWDWEVKETTPSDILKEILEYEKIRPAFCIEHIEETFKYDEVPHDVSERHRSTQNIFLGDNSDYWTWPSVWNEVENSSLKTSLPNIMQEDKIQKILSIENTEQTLKKQRNKNGPNTSDDTPYWTWPSDIDTEAELKEILEIVSKNEPNHPHVKGKIEKAHGSDVNLEKEIAAIRNAMDPAELLQWVLDSCQLGLVPSADILRKLLSSNDQNEEIDLSSNLISTSEVQSNDTNNESYWDEKQSSKEAESYWDEKPNINCADEKSYWDERPVTNDNKTDTYWDEKPQTVVECSGSRSDKVPVKDSCTQNVLTHADDNERSALAAYYMLVMNKASSIDPLPIPKNEKDERTELAAYYGTTSPKVHVNVTPIVQQHYTAEESSSCVENANKENVSYWDEVCEDCEMHEGDKDNYWDA